MNGVTSYHNRCRLCIAEARLSLKLFESEAIRLDLVNKIRSYLSINVSLHDGMPQKICYECLSRIELFHSYKQSCLESQHTLKHWNLFCDGGSVPPDVDIFSGRSQSPDFQLDDADPFTSSLPKKNMRKNSESLLHVVTPTTKKLPPSLSHADIINITPPRKKPLLSPPPSQSHADITPVKKKPALSLKLIGELSRNSQPEKTVAPEFAGAAKRGRKKTDANQVASEENRSLSPNPHHGRRSRTPIRDLTPSEDRSVVKSRSPSPFHARRSQSSSRETDQSVDTKEAGGLKSGKVSTRSSSHTFVDDTLHEKNGQSPHRGRRSSTPTREIKCPPLQDSSPVQMVNAKKLRKQTVVQSSSYVDVSPGRYNSQSDTGLRIVNVESLAVSKKKISDTPPEAIHRDSRSVVSCPEIKVKNNLLADNTDKLFAPTISEMVKQRKRSNSVSSQSYVFVNKRKPRTKSVFRDSSLGRINSDDNEDGWQSEPELSSNSRNKNFDDSKSSFDESTQALLKLLESDEEDELDYRSDFYQSDADFSGDDSSRPSTPGPRDLKTAYVKVEKLSGDEGQAPGEIKRTRRGRTRSRTARPRTQSNQYRMVKVVKDETGRERYKCIKCGSVLSNKCYIKEHMKIHTGDKSFTCSVCNKAFRNNCMLKSHMAVHKTDRSFKCDTCGHTFVQMDRLRQHMRIHVTAPFSCTICGRKITQRQSLRRHMRIHTGEKPFVCDFCGCSYADRTTLINHRRIHTGERPFTCPVCKKRFSRRVSLRAHMRVHSDDRPFSCQLCLSRFKSKGHLVKHLSYVHRDLMESVVSLIKREAPTTVAPVAPITVAPAT